MGFGEVVFGWGCTVKCRVGRGSVSEDAVVLVERVRLAGAREREGAQDVPTRASVERACLVTSTGACSLVRPSHPDDKGVTSDVIVLNALRADGRGSP